MTPRKPTKPQKTVVVPAVGNAWFCQLCGKPFYGPQDAKASAPQTIPNAAQAVNESSS